MTITEQLEQITNMRDAITAITLSMQAQIDAVMTPEQRAQIADIRLEHAALQARIDALLAALRDAGQIIARGVELLPLDQFSQWPGVRAWQEQTAPLMTPPLLESEWADFMFYYGQSDKEQS